MQELYIIHFLQKSYNIQCRYSALNIRFVCFSENFAIIPRIKKQGEVRNETERKTLKTANVLHCNFPIGSDLGKVRALSLNTHHTTK